MNTYGWLLLGQTLLALLVLGLCGGWVLWPFRRAERPYLFLAAPLAGAFALGGALAVFYFGTHLPFRWCLRLGFGANAVATAVCLVRGFPGLPAPSRRGLAAVVALAAAYWATTACNKTAIECREPTLMSLDGSDMFGYPIVADWVQAHPWSEPPGRAHPLEVMPHVNLVMDGGRPLAFLTAAAAGEVRGTSSMFSYDWASGVLLAAAALGFGGVFASNGLTLVLLVAGAGVSNWLPNARTGYLARSLAYPGTVLMAGLFFSAVGAVTRGRLAVLAALGFAVAFSLAPVFPAVVLGLLSGAYVAALGGAFVAARWRDPGASFRERVARPVGAALALYLAAVAPAFVAYQLPRGSVPLPGAPAHWPVIIPVALDLEPPALPLLEPATERLLLYGSALALLVLAGWAVQQRQPVAFALVAFALVVPGSWLFRVNLLYTLQGVIFPLTLAGAAVLAVPLARARWGRARVAILAVVMAATVGIRVPPARATADRYVHAPPTYRCVVRQSDARALRAAIGSEPVDVVLGHFADNHTVLAELAAQGVTVQFRSPTWERSLKNWAKGVDCPEPDLDLPKARFTLMEKNAYAPPETVRWVGSRLKLVEDRDAVSVLGIAGTQEMLWDPEWRPGVWIGNTPTTLLIHNGTGRPQCVRLIAATSAGPGHPNRDVRTLGYRLNDHTGTLSLPNENTAAIPLHLAPGLNRVELFVVERASPEPTPKAMVPLLAFCNWRIEPTNALPRADQR